MRRTCFAPLSTNDIGSILTRISAAFGTATRDVSQNGNWFRVIPIMESFERPPRSVPTDDLTIVPASSGIESANAFGEMWLQEQLASRRSFLSPRARKTCRQV